MGDLWEVDPIALVRPALAADADLVDELGGPDRVVPRNTPPYPCIVLTDPPGDDRRMQHLIAPLVQIEVLGDLDGTPGKPALRRIAYKALRAIAALPEQEYGLNDVVVTDVGSSGGVGWSPLPNGQPRYVTTVRIYAHPPYAPTITP